MILTNITRALREQNWLAVAIEFVIVILGVVVGFQVTAWNAARQDRALEHTYLVRLASEFEAVQEELEDQQDDLTEAREQALRFIAALDAGDADAMQADAFALISITRVSEVQIQSAALIELISSGRLGLIRNADLRAALARLPLTEADAHAVFDQFKAQQVDIIDELRPYVRVQTEAFNVTDVALQDPAIMNATELGNTLSYSVYVNNAARLYLAVLRSNVSEVQGLLAAELGAESDTP